MWPTPQDYNEAIQNPRLAFEDAQLKTGWPEITALGLPKPRSGSFASVYHLSSEGSDWAVRCFLHHFGDQQQRYEEIARFLARRPLPYMVDFSFLPSGIFIHERWFPILKMEWINGEQLNDWIEKTGEDTAAFERIRDRFVELCRELSTAGIAHGDLQHGNILVVGDKLKLVDYDGMFLPELSLLGSNELGHRNYQHPARSKQHFANHLDRFSAWSIYTSLYCLSRDPHLWHRLSGGDECLLFRHGDYKHPEQSNAFRVLEHHELPEIRRAAKQLRKLLELPLEQLPKLGEPIEGAEALSDLEPPSKLPVWLLSQMPPSPEGERQAAPDADAPGSNAPATVANDGSPSWANDDEAQRVMRSRSADQFLNNLANAASGKNSLAATPSPAASNDSARPGEPMAANRPPNLTTSSSDPLVRLMPGQIPGFASSAPAGSGTGGGIAPGGDGRDWLKRFSPKPLLLFVLFVLVAGALLYQIGYSTFFHQDPGLKSDSANNSTINAALERGKTALADARRLALKSDNAAAIVRFQQAFTEFEVAGSEQGMAACAYQIGLCYRATHDDTQAISWMEKAISRFHANYYSPMILTDIGVLYLNHQELDRAAYYLVESLQWNHQIDKETGLRVAKILRQLGITLLKREDTQGLEAYEAALTYEDLQHERDPLTCYEELKDAAQTLEHKKNLQLAFAVWRRAYEVSVDRAARLRACRLEALHALARIADAEGKTDLARSCEEHAAELEEQEHLESQNPQKDAQSIPANSSPEQSSGAPSSTVLNPRRKPDPPSP